MIDAPEMQDEMMASEASEMTEGMCIKICVYPDGQLAVSKEPLPQKEMGEGMEGTENPNEQMVEGIGEALKVALGLYKNAVAGTAKEQLQAGYDSL